MFVTHLILFLQLLFSYMYCLLSMVLSEVMD